MLLLLKGCPSFVGFIHRNLVTLIAIVCLHVLVSNYELNVYLNAILIFRYLAGNLAKLSSYIQLFVLKIFLPLPHLSFFQSLYLYFLTVSWTSNNY